jgi:hypothetical protein
MSTKPTVGGTALLLTLMGSSAIASAHSYHGYSTTVYSLSEPYLAVEEDDDDDDYITSVSRQFDFEDSEDDEENED